MSELNIGRIVTDEGTERTRKIVFACMYIGLAIAPFILYKTFFTQKTEIVYVGQACEAQLKDEKARVNQILEFERLTNNR